MTKKESDQTSYNIRIKGRLDERWSEWFERLTFTHESDGTTTLSGPIPDQAALHSILLKIRDMNLTLISVTQSESNTENLKGDFLK
jgi:hypothetical protein